MWEYQAKVQRVVDGDTLHLHLDLGTGVQRTIEGRVKGVDTHETYGVSEGSKEYQRGKREEDFVIEWLQEAIEGHKGEWPLIVRTTKMGSFNRWLVEVKRKSDGESLAAALIRRFGDDVVYTG